MKKQTAIIMLVVVTIIWGGGFVATKLALDGGVSAGMLNMIRGLVFSVLIFAFFSKEILTMSKEQLKNGLFVGIFNFMGFIFQTIGAMYTTPSNSSFLTTTNVVMVPFLAWLILKSKPKMRNLLAVVVCMTGMGVLTGIFQAEFVLNMGDAYTVIGAFFFALSIVLLAKQPEDGHFATGAFLMGFTLFLGGAIYTFFIEGANFAVVDWKSTILPILYLAVGSNFIAQTLQIIGQRYVPATTASLIFMLEGVFGSIFSIMWGFEKFTINLLVGGGLILFSLILSEMPIVKKKR